MKKLTALMLILLVGLIIVGCSSSTETANDHSAASSDQASEIVSASTGSSNKPYATIADYLEDTEVKEAISSALEESNSDLFSDMQVYADGNILVYDYTYSQVYDENAVASMKKGFEEKSDKEYGFDSVLNTLKTNVDVENPLIEVIYRNGDGSIIASRIFS